MPVNEGCISRCTNFSNWYCGPSNTVIGKAARFLCCVSFCSVSVSCCGLLHLIYTAGAAVNKAMLSLSASVGIVGCILTPLAGHACFSGLELEEYHNNSNEVITRQPIRQLNAGQNLYDVESLFPYNNELTLMYDNPPSPPPAYTEFALSVAGISMPLYNTESTFSTVTRTTETTICSDTLNLPSYEEAISSSVFTLIPHNQQPSASISQVVISSQGQIEPARL